MHSSRTGRRLLGGASVVAALALPGCGLLAEHTADTATQPPPPPPPTTSSAQPLPPRPFDIALDGLNPCELLTADQRAQLGFDREPLPDSEAGFGDAATCSYRNTTAKVGARLSLITTEGMGVWTDDTAQVEATPVVIGGFPALVIKTPDLNLSCNVAIDVAEGQHVDVLYRDDGGRPAPPLESLCAGAQRVAEDTVASLVAPPTSSSEKPSRQPETESEPVVEPTG
ncbi:DUF3558 domain-containing protein [Saccharopolyspora erythraea]|uniref:DUF3558 domain-containing protein n=1 Tax=Saccharopolyspora erythraea TaxID=1836 RepID=UPI001BA4C080|nr:DUF3558 domain-containing protein [Saccharopolyspora erythraea]QUH04900.1 DUF3558 domain-containing protein [Saccharopolyspora erythraea]